MLLRPKKNSINSLVQSDTFTMSPGKVFELIIAEDVQMIPVTLRCSSNCKTFQWQAPFTRFPIDVEVRNSYFCAVVLSEENKDAKDSKESTKIVEPSSTSNADSKEIIAKVEASGNATA